MTAIDQDPVNEARLAREVEPHAVASWPAHETLAIDGWLARFSDGSSGRANSIATHCYSGDNIDRAIAAAETAYRARDRPVQFQITPATQPVDLADGLIARGYHAEPASILMTADASDVVANAQDEPVSGSLRTDFVSPSSPDFARLTLAGSRSEIDGRERLAILENIRDTKTCVVLAANDRAISSGASVVTGAWASVYVMRTAPESRRRGYAWRILTTMTRWAIAQGASRLYLQVDGANVAAHELYTRAEFRDGYRYRNYRLD